MADNYGFPVQISQCFWCGQAKNEILIGQRAVKNAGNIPMQAVYNYEPCDTCEADMGRGITMIEVTAHPHAQGQPPMAQHPKEAYPTGRWMVVTPEFIQRIVSPPTLAAKIIAMCKSFIDPEAYNNLLTPKEAAAQPEENLQ